MDKQPKIFMSSLGGVVVGCVGASTPPPLDKHLARGHSDLAPVLLGGEPSPEQKTRRSISLWKPQRDNHGSTPGRPSLGRIYWPSHQVRIRIASHEIFSNQMTHLGNCAHNRKKLLIASNDRDGAAANRLHGTESDLYRGRL